MSIYFNYQNNRNYFKNITYVYEFIKSDLKRAEKKMKENQYQTSIFLSGLINLSTKSYLKCGDQVSRDSIIFWMSSST